MASWVGDNAVFSRRRIQEVVIRDEIYTITDLGQVRVLADPFRLRLLGAFGAVPRTTKQVAEQLGEKPTKLYHHVEALERAGLLVLTETRPNRGTLEKYYQTVATRFRVDPGLFPTGVNPGPMRDETSAMLMSILDTTRAELAEALNRSEGGSEKCPGSPAMVARMLLRGKRERIAQFRARLLALLDEFKAETAGVESRREDTYGFTLAFYPLPAQTDHGEPREAVSGTAVAGSRRQAKRRASPVGYRSADKKQGRVSPGTELKSPESASKVVDSRKGRHRGVAPTNRGGGGS